MDEVEIEEMVQERVRLARGRGRPMGEARVDHLRRMTFRNAAIQAVGPRPSDGVTFGTGKVPEEGKRGRKNA